VFIKYWLIFFICSACGSSKRFHDEVRDESFLGIPPKGNQQLSKETLRLKTEELKLTSELQVLQENQIQQNSGAQKYSEIKKVFHFPIQFSGWVSLTTVHERTRECLREQKGSCHFFLLDDHSGETLLQIGERHQVVPEKFYAIRSEFKNLEKCQGVDIEFSVSFGINE
jgi:hypothetical protein